ncbi:MAG: hypothetical protein JWP37_2332 [Mucilaginibacter sp.]|nr:hypothetical protein [Mucilaginibacter sp.]
MKYFACFLSALVILGTSACKKDSGAKGNTTLQGKWKVIGSMISSGGPMYFVPDNGNHYAQFNTDGTITGSAFPDEVYYKIKDSITITMTKADKITYEDYYYKIKQDSLTLGPAGPIVCIEGCSIKLIKDWVGLN